MAEAVGERRPRALGRPHTVQEGGAHARCRAAPGRAGDGAAGSQPGAVQQDPRPVASSAPPRLAENPWSGREKAEPLADLVAPLARGLPKMQEAATAAYSEPSSSYGSRTPTYDKLGELQSEEFDEIDPRDEQLRNDPAFQRAGDQSAADQRKAVRDRSFWKRIRNPTR